MEQIIVRKATHADMPTLLRFEQGVISAERPFDDSIKPDPVQYYNIEEMIVADHIELLVAEMDGQVVGSGYARVENSRHFIKNPLYAYLGFMFVEPAYRGMGVNKEIIRELKAWAVQKEIVQLRLDVYDGNISAIKAYEKVGFRKDLINMEMFIG